MQMKYWLLLLVTACFFIGNTAFAQQKRESTVENAKAFVLEAIDYINANGLEKGLAEIQNPNGKFHTKELYIFVVEHRGKMVAHGANPGLVGKNVYEMRDSDGVALFHEFAKKVEENPEGGWVYYKWPNPATKMIEKKATFVKDLDGTNLVGCGVYQ